MKVGRLHILTDYFFQQRYTHAQLAAMARDGGAEVIQFRQKFGGIRHELVQARSTAEVCRDKACTLLINDHLAVALAVGAQGVHLGQSDFPIEEARKILGPDAVIGATATTLAQALAAAEAGADYVGFGPVFPTRSKANPASVKGIRGLEEVCSEVQIPVIAIAGITPSRVRPVLQAGAHGIAVMTAVTNADDPQDATARFRRAIDDYFAT